MLHVKMKYKLFKNINNFKGYSLTEILLTILIFATTLTPLINLFIQSVRDVEVAVDYFKVSNYASLEIEKLKSLYILNQSMFKNIYKDITIIEKKYEKYNFKITIDPSKTIQTISAYNDKKITTTIVEITVLATWVTKSGRKQNLSFNLSL